MSLLTSLATWVWRTATAPWRLLVWSLAAVRRRLVRTRNRAIASYVAGTVRRLTAPGGEMEIGAVTVRGSTYRAYVNAPRTLTDWYASGRAHGALEFVVYTGAPSQRWTFDEFFRKCDAVSANLARQLGVRRGDRVAVLMANIPEFCVAFTAVTQLGAVCVTLNAFWEAKEIEFGLRDSQACVFIGDDKRVARLVPNARLDRVARELELKVVVVRPSPELLAARAGLVAFESLLQAPAPGEGFRPASDLDADSDACIMYTSGTTSGQPKGVVLTHRSFCQSLMCFQLFASVLNMLRGENKLRRCDLVTSPLFHAASLTATFLLAFKAGHKLVMMPRWDADIALQVCLDERVTFLGAMPTMLADVLKSPVFVANKAKFAFTNIGTGGAATPSELIRRVADVLPGVGQGSGWGLSESNSIGTVAGGPDYLENPRSCGKPHAIVELKLVDPETGADLPAAPSTVGELCIKSVTSMRCYWNQPEKTAAAFLPGGWIRSGDIGRVDEDGFVYIVDRAKDIIIRGGENISSNEVEDCVFELPGARVFEAAAFGLPDERLGEMLCVAVVGVDGAAITEDEVKRHCAEGLAKFKVPAHVFVRPLSRPLPRSGTGKILKRVLRDEYGGAVQLA